MRIRISLLLVVALVSFLSVTVHAKDEVIYRQRANWVKIVKANPKNVPVGSIKHPYSIGSDELENMLLSIQISKRFVLTKKVNSQDVFNAYEARKYSAYITSALEKATPDRVVHFSVVHKRPLFILRNDHISMGSVWYDSEGLHVQFTKLFAKIAGDYEAEHNMDQALRQAKTLRVTLEAAPGQKLAYQSPNEVIFDPQHDFASQVAAKREADLSAQEDYLAGGNKKKAKGEASYVSSPKKSVTARLQELAALKDQKMISEAEYQKLRSKILNDI